MRKAAGGLGIIAAVALALAGMGCTTMVEPPSDAELIGSTMNTWLDGMKRKDVDDMLAVMSDDFTSDMNRSKAEFKSNMERFIAEGNLNNITLDATKAAISIQDQTATYTPVTIVTNQGSATMHFSLKKIGANWLISGLTLDY